jgi:cysteine synthase
VPGCVSGLDLEEVERVARQLTVERNASRTDQSERAGNWRVNLRTGEEPWEQTNDHVDAFVDFIGSGGTYVGVIRVLEARNPRMLARDEGIFGGFSAGANLAAAIRELALLPAGSTVAMSDKSHSAFRHRTDA